MALRQSSCMLLQGNCVLLWQTALLYQQHHMSPHGILELDSPPASCPPGRSAQRASAGAGRAPSGHGGLPAGSAGPAAQQTRLEGQPTHWGAEVLRPVWGLDCSIRCVPE